MKSEFCKTLKKIGDVVINKNLEMDIDSLMKPQKTQTVTSIVITGLTFGFFLKHFTTDYLKHPYKLIGKNK